MDDGAALAMLEDIQADALKNAAAMPLKSSGQTERQGLGFQIGGVRLVSPLGEIREVLTLPRLAHLPGVKPWVRGIANVRGRLIPVIDMHGFLAMTPTLPKAQWRVLVVEDDDMVAGLLVEQSLGMQYFLEDAFSEQPVDGLDSLGPFINGGYRQGGRVYHEIALGRVLRDEAFFDVAVRDRMSPGSDGRAEP